MKGTAHKPAKNCGFVPKAKGGTGRTSEGASTGKPIPSATAVNDPLCYANGRGQNLPPDKKANPKPVCFAQGPQPFKK